MLLMLAVVACYTICSLSDKYAVSKLSLIHISEPTRH